MGTRGFMGYVVDGDVRATYNHYDSYPDGLGAAVGEFAASLTGARLAEYADKARRMQFVSEDEPPTAEQREALAEFSDGGVSTGSDWYAVLRLTQGDMEKTLDVGYMPDSTAFAYDSLMCEWGYLVNFDTGMVEVYRGFQTDPSRVVGRFAEPLPSTPVEMRDGVVVQAHRSSQYSPVTLLGQLPFPLCASEMFWGALGAAVAAADDAAYEADDEAGYVLDFERLAVVVGEIEA